MLSGVPTRRLVAYGAAVAVLVAGVAAFLLTRSDPGPVWAGPPLSAAQGTATRYEVVALSPAAPQEVAAKAMLALGPLTERPVPVRGARVYDSESGAEIHVRPERPTVVFAQRPVAGDAPQGEDRALGITRATMTRYGMEPEHWEPTVRRTGNVWSVRYTYRTAFPMFEAAGVPSPLASFAVDGRGLQVMTLTLVRLEPEEVRVISEREAFERLSKLGRYVSVRMVVVNTGKGAVEPYWEFKAADGKLRPVPAVLTP